MWANTTISVLTGTLTNAAGDEYENTTVGASGIPASIITRGRHTWDKSTNRPRVIETVALRVRTPILITFEDMIKDERTGDIFKVLTVDSRVRSLVNNADQHIRLSRVTLT